MKIKPNELIGNGYELQSQLQHNDIAVFIQPYIFRKNIASVFYWLFTICVVVGSIYEIFTCDIGIGKSFEFYALGFCGLLPLIPLHELIHGLFYKIDGAPAVQYKANFKKFIFYAMADQYVINFSSFVALALAPFVIINSLLLIAIFLTSGSLSFLFAGMLLFKDVVPYLNGWKRITTIIVLVLYASYRFSRIYKDFKTNKQQNERI